MNKKTIPQVNYHYYTMCTLQDMDLNQNFNQSVTDGRTDKGNTICHIHIRGRDINRQTVSILSNIIHFNVIACIIATNFNI